MELDLSINSYKHKKNEDYLLMDTGLHIFKNGLYLITGNSGSGKTTLLKIILGLLGAKDEVSITFRENGKQYSPLELRKNGDIGYHPDDRSFLPWLSIEDNILLPFKLNNTIDNSKKSNLDKYLTDLELDNSVLTKKPFELSFGMKARVNLIRACITNPKILIIDELYSGLDLPNCLRINSFLSQFIDEKMVIAATHLHERAKSITKNRFHLYKKQLKEIKEL